MSLASFTAKAQAQHQAMTGQPSTPGTQPLHPMALNSSAVARQQASACQPVSTPPPSTQDAATGQQSRFVQSSAQSLQSQLTQDLRALYLADTDPLFYPCDDWLAWPQATRTAWARHTLSLARSLGLTVPPQYFPWLMRLAAPASPSNPAPAQPMPTWRRDVLTPPKDHGPCPF